MRSDIKQILSDLTDVQRDLFAHWLEHTNPSPLHNAACKLREGHTGRWMARSTEWRDWLNESSFPRLLWIHGIPGCGKTILASTLIEQIRNGHLSSNDGLVYYYCYFGHNQDESIPLLKWIVGQLCRQTRKVPKRLYTDFQQNLEPPISSLLLAVSELLDNFDRLYVVIDAVDESQERKNLLNIVKQFVTGEEFRKISVLATSREYIDIGTVFSAIYMPVSMSNPLVAEDIRSFVKSTLESDIRFSHWPSALAAEVEQALADDAKGM